MRMKLKDVRSGATYDTTFRPEEKFEKHISTQNLYNICTRWMIQLSSWIWKHMSNMKFL